MDKSHQETCVDTGLALGLSVSRASVPAAKNNSVPKPNSMEPSLTLSIPESMHTNLPKLEPEISKHSFTGTTCVPSPPHSAVTAFSAGYIHGMVKREREIAGEVLSNNSNSRASEEDDDGGTRKKLRLTKEQSALLEDRFKEHTTLNPKQKQALAKQLNLRPRQVEVWFQNRRARTKLKQTEVDCEFLKRCCETLTEENRRLQKELHDLKALKFAPPPHYMQFPPQRSHYALLAKGLEEPAARIRKTETGLNPAVDLPHLNHISTTLLPIQQPVRWERKELRKKRR